MKKALLKRSKQAELGFLGFEIMNAINGEPLTSEEEIDVMRRQYEKLQKATTWEEMREILHYSKEYFARSLLEMKDVRDDRDPELVKIIDDMANQKPQNLIQNNPNRKNKKRGKINTVNTGNKVNNAGENVQTGVGSLQQFWAY